MERPTRALTGDAQGVERNCGPDDSTGYPTAQHGFGILAPATAITTARLQEHHLADLRSSGLSDETIHASGCYAATEATTRELLGFGVGSGLVFPFPGTEEKPGLPFVQVKPDIRPEWMNGKGKYLTPKNAGCRLYLSPTLPRETLTNCQIPLLITEGAKKALKATQEGLPCVALAGVDAWKDHRTGKSAPIPDLD